MLDERQVMADYGLLHCTIERQLSRKPTFLPGAASHAIGQDLPITKHLGAGSYIRTGDISWHSLGGIWFTTSGRLQMAGLCCQPVIESNCG